MDNIDDTLGYMRGLLEGIKRDIKDLDEKLDAINGRVRKNEQDIAQAKGIGVIAGIVFGSIFGAIGGFLKELIRG